MKTQYMNQRITFFKNEGSSVGGELQATHRRDIFSCWCEVTKATMKEFKSRERSASNGQLKKLRDTKVFVIRAKQQEEIDNSMCIDFKGKAYEIIDIEHDYLRQDMLLVKAELIS